MFAARLRLPSSVSLEEKRAVVDSLLNKLSLVKAADTIVGDAKRRGISGGERKRLSIGCELIGSPNLLFLDEPTSGLDAFQAQQVVALLKQLALEGTAVVAVIHQPRGTSFKMFDDLLLLSEGQLMFSGEAARAAAHFGRLGHRCPSGIAEAEHVVISAFGLTGSIPASVGKCAKAKKLHLQGNQLEGAVPASELAKLTALEKFALVQNEGLTITASGKQEIMRAAPNAKFWWPRVVDA